jgi:maleate isomerase
LLRVDDAAIHDFPLMARPGARGRIGVIQPAPGVMLEHEWPHWLPDGLLFPVARVRLSGGDVDDFERLAAAAPEAARDLASAGANVVAYACTLGSLYAGRAAEDRLVAELAQASGKPALALGSACTDALRKLGAKRLAIMTPYGDAQNAWVEAYIRSQGFAIAGFVATPMGIATVGDMSPADVSALAIESLAALPEADALWLPCTAMQTMAAIETIEAATARPVVSGSQALLWKSLATLGIADPIEGAVSLFR